MTVERFTLDDVRITARHEGDLSLVAETSSHHGELSLSRARPGLLSVTSRRGTFLLMVGEAGTTAHLMAGHRREASIPLAPSSLAGVPIAWSAIVIRERPFRRIDSVVFTAGADVPATEPGTVQATEPGTVPATEPGTVQATEPGTVQATEPGTVLATEPVMAWPSRSFRLPWRRRIPRGFAPYRPVSPTARPEDRPPG